jgi:hypothetical protein
MTALMKDLVGGDAERGYRAVWELATVPEGVRRLEELVRPVPTVDAAHLKDLIAKLDSDDFQVREKATAELRSLRDVAEPMLRDLLRQSRSAEVRRRAEGLLEHLAENGEEVASARALEVLERLNTTESLRLLEAAAKGAPEAWLTRQAKAVLERIPSSRAMTP